MRISGSGDGCGDHWPFCHGEFIPDSHAIKVWIENFHRISTKLYGLFSIGLFFLSLRWFPKGHSVRFWTGMIFVFTLIEGLIGAVIVLKGFVANDDSLGRSILIAFHLANTFLLTSVLVFSWLASKNNWQTFQPVKGLLHSRIIWITGLVITVGATGALAALSTTLFPSQSLLEGFLYDFSTESHFLLKIRIFHPLLATALLFGGLWFSSSVKKVTEPIQKWCTLFNICLVVTFSFGVLTLSFLSPVWMKLAHLFLAYLLWISLMGLWSYVDVSKQSVATLVRHSTKVRPKNPLTSP